MADDATTPDDPPELDELRRAVIRCWVHHFPTLSAPALAARPLKAKELCEHVRTALGRQDIPDETILDVLRRCGA